MSDEIREQEWKAMWESQEFKPPADGWEKMARALSGAAVDPAPKIIPWWGWRRYGKIAAAAAVLGLGTWSIWQFSQQPVAISDPAAGIAAVTAPANQPEAAIVPQAPAEYPAADTKPAARKEKTYIAAALPVVREYIPLHTGTTVYSKPEVSSIQDSMAIVKVPAEQVRAITEVPPATLKPETPKNMLAKVQGSRSGFEPISNQTGYFDEPQLDKSMSIGLAANIGKPNLGNIQYNVGVVLRKEWTDAFYTEASVSMAATDVRFSDNARYGISYKNGEMVNSEGMNAIAANTIGETQNVYGNNILGVGIAPMVGYKITRQVSVSVGVDVYRNINTGLNLYYNSDIAQKDIKAMSMVKNVSQWDSGLKGQLGIRISNALSVLGQYRQGLTNYITTDHTSYKSSLFNIGFMYRFQP